MKKIKIKRFVAFFLALLILSGLFLIPVFSDSPTWLPDWYSVSTSDLTSSPIEGYITPLYSYDHVQNVVPSSLGYLLPDGILADTSRTRIIDYLGNNVPEYLDCIILDNSSIGRFLSVSFLDQTFNFEPLSPSVDFVDGFEFDDSTFFNLTGNYMLIYSRSLTSGGSLQDIRSVVVSCRRHAYDMQLGVDVLPSVNYYISFLFTNRGGATFELVFQYYVSNLETMYGCNLAYSSFSQIGNSSFTLNYGGSFDDSPIVISLLYSPFDIPLSHFAFVLPQPSYLAQRPPIYLQAFNIGYQYGVGDVSLSYDRGYSDGYIVGVDVGKRDPASNSVIDVIKATIEAPFYLVSHAFDFTVFGINFANLIFGVLSLLVAFFVIRFIVRFFV